MKVVAIPHHVGEGVIEPTSHALSSQNFVPSCANGSSDLKKLWDKIQPTVS